MAEMTANGDGDKKRDTFYNALRYTFIRFLHENWSVFIAFIWGDEPDG